MIMKQNIILLLLLIFSIGIQAQSIKFDKQDKFTGFKEKRTSFEKIISDPLIMGIKDALLEADIEWFSYYEPEPECNSEESIV